MRFFHAHNKYVVEWTKNPNIIKWEWKSNNLSPIKSNILLVVVKDLSLCTYVGMNLFPLTRCEKAFLIYKVTL